VKQKKRFGGKFKFFSKKIQKTKLHEPSQFPKRRAEEEIGNFIKIYQ